MEISKRLKELRATRNITQKHAAEAAGMKIKHYQRYEYGDRTPRIEQLVALADFFDVSLDYLVGRSDDPERHLLLKEAPTKKSRKQVVQKVMPPYELINLLICHGWRVRKPAGSHCQMAKPGEPNVITIPPAHEGPSRRLASQDAVSRSSDLEEAITMVCTYPAFFHYEDNCCWVEFPDLPGCFSDGETPDEAKAGASESLGLYLEGMIEEKLPFASPSDPDTLHIDDGFVALVTAKVEPKSESAAV